MTFWSASTLTAYSGFSFAAAFAVMSFARTFPDKYSSAVTYFTGSVFGILKIIPRKSSMIFSCVLPVSCAIYSKSTRAFSPMESASASLAVSTNVTSRCGLIVRFVNISAFLLNFPSSSSTSREHKRK